MCPPGREDGVTFDANCCITIALHLGTVQGREIKSYYVDPLRAFLRMCQEKKISIAQFPFIRDESYRNLAKAVNETAKARGIGSPYVRLKMLDRAQATLDRFFSKVPEIQCQPSQHEIDDARDFFRANEIDVAQTLNLQRPKPNIPEDNDLKLLVCADRLPWGSTYVVSDDGHFVAYEAALKGSEYDVRVLPMKEITQRTIIWKWRL